MKLLIIIVLITLLSVPIAYSKPTDASVDYLTNIVYQDCQNKDLHIKDGFIINAETNKTVTLINWFYPKSTVRRIIELFGNYEPFDLDMGGMIMSVGKNGAGILKCGSHNLDINQYTYFWDGVRVDLPKEEILQYQTYNTAINNQGNLVQGLENNNITQKQTNTEINNLTLNLQESKKENFWLSYIYPPIQSLILSILGYLLINPKSTKKQRLINTTYYFVTILIVSFLIIYLFKQIA